MRLANRALGVESLGKAIEVDKHGTHPLDRPTIPGRVDWGGYWQAIQRCDMWWKSTESSRFSVLAPNRSWRGAIAKLGRTLQHDWSDFDELDQRRLLGLAWNETTEDWALLGRMRDASRRAVFEDPTTRSRIERSVRHVIEAADDAFPGVAVEAYGKLRSLPGIGGGVTTRLLTLARPDRLVSVNGGSAAGLARYARLAPTTLPESARNYDRLLRFIYQMPWFRTPVTDLRSDLQKEVWSMRAALLDSFVYSARRHLG